MVCHGKVKKKCQGDGRTSMRRTSSKKRDRSVFLDLKSLPVNE